MNRLFLFAFLIISSVIISCSKDDIITSGDALLRTSEDTLHFDTVFTSAGSITKFFKIHNDNDARINLSNVQLMGGSSSPFQMNVDGSAGTQLSNIEIAKGDSIYVFVRLNINPTTTNLPFIVTDSVRIDYNGNTRFVQLDAYGQNANFLRGAHTENDTTWTNDKPVVILDGFNVSAGTRLTINAGTRIYYHANSPMIVNGTLLINGTASNRVTFAGDRLDEPYKNFPASWPGMVFGPVSSGNILNYAVIKNAYQGCAILGYSLSAVAKLTLNQCIIDNTYDAAIYAENSSIDATNCLISNAGSNIQLLGGEYNFNHCTVVSYSNAYLTHKSPVLSITNIAENTPVDLYASFRNCIFYGEGGTVENEIVTGKQGNTQYSVVFNNVLYKVKDNDPANATFSNSIKNQSPSFTTIENGRMIYDFRLQDNSPCINAGTNSSTSIDLNGNPRGASIPDIGAYEKQ